MYLSDSSADTNHSSKLDTKKLDNSPTQTYSLQSQTVSANKFDQSLREIDGSVALANGKKLQDLQINSTKDLGKIFPGFVLKTQSRAASVMTSIRGISTPDAYNPSIVIYVDGIPQDPAFLNQELLNVTRIELLRGPQGTIWGQNAQAGVLNIISNPIDSNTPRLNASTSIGSLYKNAMLSASTPLVKDWLYIGGSLSYNRFSGQIKNNAPSNDARNQNQDTSDSLLGTASIAFVPKNSGFQALFKYSKNNLTDHRTGFFLNEDEYDKLEAGEKHFYPLGKRDVSTYALKLGYDFGASSLSNVVSFQESDMKSYVEYQPSGLLDHTKTTTNELRLTTQYDNGAYSIFGLYYQNIDFKSPAIAGQINKQDISVFAEGKVPLWYDFDFTLGLRYAYDVASKKKDLHNTKDSHQTNFLTPKVALGYDVNEDIRLYLLYALGYKPGGFDFWSGNKLKPENTQNAELGIHAGFWGNKISLDASLYYIYIIDKQIYVGDGGFGSVLKNAGTADSKGMELGFSILPIERVKFSLGMTYGQARYVKYYDEYKKKNYSGNTLSFAPDFTINGNVDWKFLHINKADFFFNINANFYSKTYFAEDNILSQKPYGLLDLALRIETKDNLSLNFFVTNTLNQKNINTAFLIGMDNSSMRYMLGDLRNIGMSLSYRY